MKDSPRASGRLDGASVNEMRLSHCVQLGGAVRDSIAKTLFTQHLGWKIERQNEETIQKILERRLRPFVGL